MAPAGGDGAEPSALPPASATGFPSPPQPLAHLLLEATLHGGNAAIDRCHINGFYTRLVVALSVS